MNNRRRKKIKKCTTFLKRNPDFLKIPASEKKEVTIVASEQDMEFLKNFGGLDFREKNNDNVFNYKF